MCQEREKPGLVVRSPLFSEFRTWPKNTTWREGRGRLVKVYSKACLLSVNLVSLVSQMQGKENKQFKEAVEAQQRMIESQTFVMTNLRNGIEYLKNTCKNAGQQSTYT